MLFTVSSFFTALLGFLGIGSLSVKEIKKQYDAINYGIKVDVGGLDMNVVIQGDQHDQTIVLLPGLGMFSPYITYKSLTEPLSQKYKIITVEPFGYGLSDVTKKERTNENIIDELHSCLKDLGVNQYYLMGHSIGGLYSLAYSKKYSKEVLGFIGLDNTPTNIEEILEAPTFEQKIKERINAKLRLFRFDDSTLKEYVKEVLDPNYKYTEEDMKNLSIIYHYNFVNENLIEENELTIKNVSSLKKVSFECPVIMFISKETCEEKEIWRSSHHSMIVDNKNASIHEIHGTHMIYINNTLTIMDELEKFIK